MVRSTVLTVDSVEFCLSVSVKITNKHLMSCFYQFLNTIGCSFVVEWGGGGAKTVYKRQI